MTFRLIIFLFAVSFAAFNALAVDGVAVSYTTTQTEIWSTPWGGNLRRYEIKGNEVVSQKVIYSGTGRHPTFNVEGTHIAFFRKTDNGEYLSLMTSDGDFI